MKGLYATIALLSNLLYAILALRRLNNNKEQLDKKSVNEGCCMKANVNKSSVSTSKRFVNSLYQNAIRVDLFYFLQKIISL